MGQIVYISILKAEVGSKLVPASLLSPPRLTYQYGWSFLMLVSSFLSCEVTGTLAIFLYMYHHQYRWLSKQDETSLANRLFMNQVALLSQSGHSDIAQKAMQKVQGSESKASLVEVSTEKKKRSQNYSSESHGEQHHAGVAATDQGAKVVGNGRPTVHNSMMMNGGGGGGGGGGSQPTLAEGSGGGERCCHRPHPPTSLPLTPHLPCR